MILQSNSTFTSRRGGGNPIRDLSPFVLLLMKHGGLSQPESNVILQSNSTFTSRRGGEPTKDLSPFVLLLMEAARLAS